MVLNYIWIFFFAVAFIVALFRLVIGGDTEVFSAMMTSTFDMSKTGFEISLGLTGVLTLWMGIMKIGERGGAVQVMSGMINPFFRRLFPGLPQDSPAHGSIMMNLAANMLGLDNAATPMGLKAMQQMQEVNTRKDAASNAQIMFLVLNTSGLTIVPVSIMVYRAQLGAANPTDIFIPILLATYFSTLAGLIAVAIYQKINLFDRVILAYLGGISALMAMSGGIGAWHFMVIAALMIYLPHTPNIESMAKTFALLTHGTMTLLYIVVGVICVILLPLYNNAAGKQGKDRR